MLGSMKKLLKRRPGSSAPEAAAAGPLQLKLYIAGSSRASLRALENLKVLRGERWPAECRLEIIDLLRNPARAKRDDIVVVPTLVRKGPGPARRVLGDLSHTERVLSGLGLRPA